MAQLIKEIISVWSALSGSSDDEGWQCMPVGGEVTCSLMAARHFPSNEEALFVGFRVNDLPAGEKLPSGQGFAVTRISHPEYPNNRLWLALSRQKTGNQELFAEMVSDIVETLKVSDGLSHINLLRIFLGRIRAWQEFMRRDSQLLGLEAELGLMGELLLISCLIDAGLQPSIAIESWVGPLRGVQDFHIGTGAIEVKATLANVGFPAKIGSIDQLDDANRKPIFVFGVRFMESGSGKTLPDFADGIMSTLNEDYITKNMFLSKLLSAGYASAHSEHYTRHLTLADNKFLMVDDKFPRLTIGTLPLGITKATYEIDLDKVASQRTEITDVLKQLGAL